MTFIALIITFCALSTNVLSSSPTATPTLAPWVKTVHLVMSNHFDCGFANSAANIVNEYFDKYFPDAVLWGDNITNSTNLTYTWMTQSWLISMYFDCPPGFGIKCPSQQQMDYVQTGIDKGYIYWHGFPFNSQQEVYDVSMLEFGLKLSRDLSAKHKAPVSHILSQRDIPGLTRSMIPTLLNNNVAAVSVGVNDGSAPPAVPNLFRWKDIISGKTLLGLWNPGGYGGEKYPDPVYVSDFDEALVYAWKGDNQGPMNPVQMISAFEVAQQEFPNANVIASSITNFVDNLLKNQQAVDNLPEIDAEIGDNWVHGVQSDPWKTSINRAAQRLRAQCLAQGKCNLNSAAFYNFSRLLLKNGEHTWGGDIKHYLSYGKNGSDYYSWSNEQLQEALAANHSNNAMTTFRNTWYEQRNWGIYYAMEALSMSSESADQELYNNIMEEWNIISNVSSPLKDTSGWTKVSNPSQIFEVYSTYSGDKFQIQFDVNNSGAIMKLVNTKTNMNYANKDHLLSELIYGIYNETEFNDFVNYYAYKQPPPGYMHGDFGKEGLDENAHPKHQYITATFNTLYEMSGNNNKFMVAMDFGSQQNNLHTMYGAPEIIYNIIDFSNNRSTFTSDLIWINKTATRIPEDYFYNFNPINCSKWKVSKFDEMIDISNVVKNGSMHMMATTGPVTCSYSDNNTFNIESIDAALTTFIPQSQTEFTPFPVPWYYSSETTGTGFILYDNTWGTNYPVFWPFDKSNANNTYRFNIFV